MTRNANLGLLLRRLEVGRDPGRVAPVPTSLDSRTQALTRIGAAVCEGAPDSMFVGLVSEARSAGATDEEVLGVLLCVAALAGEARLVAAIPGISNALDYDIDGAFENG
ncbi:MAG TPA: carboxymuconolactone decarboxylase family protein [Acidimicrobiia bacterium]